jgi:hypothetical protein
MPESSTRTPLSVRRFVIAGMVLCLVAAAAGETVAQSGRVPEDPSHRLLPPDAATLSRLQSQAALLYRLHQMVGDQGQLPGITDPARQKRLEQIMQQMAFRLGQSELQMPGPGRQAGNRQTGRNGQSGQGFRPGNSTRPGQPRPGETGFGTGTSSTQSLRDFLKKLSEGAVASQGQSGNRSGGGSNSGRFPWSSPPDRGTGYTRSGTQPNETGDWQQPPNEDWQNRASGNGDSPFDDVTDSSLSLTERFTRIADLARVDSLGNKKSGGDSGGGSSWLSSAGIQSALTKAIDGAAKSVAERAEGGSATELGRREPRPRPGAGEGPGGLQRIGQTAEWLGSLANRATEASESMHESMATSPSDGARSSSFGMSGLVIPALLLGVAASVLWWLQRRRPDFEEASEQGRLAARMPASIRSREDVVTAFHVIAARAPAVSANWWTHRRAAVALVESKPKSGSDVETLTELYEQARYLPENEPMTDEQLALASEAVRRIGKS